MIQHLLKVKGFLILTSVALMSLAAFIINRNYWQSNAITLFLIQLLTVVCFMVLLNRISKGKKVIVNIDWLFFISVGILIYIVWHYLCIDSFSFVKIYYVICFLIGTLALRVALSNQFITIENIQFAISGYVITESIVILMQIAGLVSSSNELFPVTGISDNPNISAICLTLSIPFLFIPISTKKSKINFLNQVLGTVAVFIILYLECRTAYIGLLILLGMILLRRSWRFRMKKKYIYSLILLFIIVIIYTFHGLYQMKRESADGRFFIWKNSLELAVQDPFIGYGFQSFTTAYNDYQTDVLKALNKNDYCRYIAGYQYHIMNDYLEFTLQGGIIYLIILSLFLCISVFYRTGGLLLRSGLICYLGMSSFYCLFSTTQVMLFLIIYIASCSFKEKQKEVQFNLAFISPIWGVTLGVLLISIINFFDYCQVLKIRSQMKRGEYDIASRTIETLYIAKESYLIFSISSKIAAEKKNYKQALELSQKASLFQNHPQIYMDIGFLHYKLGDVNQSIQYYKRALDAKPSLYAPAYSLMNLYRTEGKHSEARYFANEIVSKTNKYTSEAIKTYINDANIYLHSQD